MGIVEELVAYLDITGHLQPRGIYRPIPITSKQLGERAPL